ncbi:hypothetical protein HMPREF9630_00687 [Peptoanaerobacter stomatis]|uniref:Transport permease protein n=1 Tax=Peptoanaerobacter stomatis TaxID=796937 RepID=G9XCD9_9FIRM|nr:ABC transporter permease [Peptoanaerobacter stomatis]EHL15318.1 hypothetical protein HMPREF9630_00687 [Peptoanaerobacter stomatis]EHL19332.1 hypothetical protein HMPREF9628_01516 [Peptoanaerobacter stomatis]
MYKYLLNFLKYRPLLFELVKRDLKIKYRKSILGYLWSLLNPLMMMCVVSLVFSYLFRYDIENYTLYVLVGQIVFGFYSESTNLSMMSVIDNASLLKKVYIPKYIFPISRVLSSFTNMMFSLGAIAIMICISNVKITWNIFLLPIVLLYLFVFSMGVGLILSSITVYYRDIVHLYSVFLTVCMYLTPIFYPENILPLIGKAIMLVNPLYYYVTYFRKIIILGETPSINMNFICIIFSMVSVFLGIKTFLKRQDNFLLYL